jgi:hypothetical protein
MQCTTEKSDVFSRKVKSVVFPPDKSALQNRFLCELGRELQTLLSGDAVEFVVAQDEKDMLEVLTLDLEELEKGLVILQSADVTSKDKGTSLYRDSEV